MHPEPPLSRVVLPDEDSTLALGASLAPLVEGGSLVFLVGDLGAGKTTFARGFLRARGWTESVRSPTFPILRSYPLPVPVHHLDLYRIGGLEEALGLDFESLLEGGGVVLVEWPERLEGHFHPDWTVHLSIEGEGSVAATTRGR